MQLPGPLAEKLLKALEDAFRTRKSLEEFVRFNLSTLPDTIFAPSETLPQAIIKLIDWAEAQDRLAALLKWARHRRPGNKMLSEVDKDFRRLPEFTSSWQDAGTSISNYLNQLCARSPDRPFGRQPRRATVRRYGSKRDALTPKPLFPLLCARAEQLILLHGPRGIGKSTSLQMFASGLAGVCKSGLGSNDAPPSPPHHLLKHPVLGWPIPILVSATDGSFNEMEPLDWVTSIISDNPICLDSPYVILLIDGIDALAPDRRHDLINALQELIDAPRYKSPTQFRAIVASQFLYEIVHCVVQIEPLTVSESKRWLGKGKLDPNLVANFVEQAKGLPLMLKLGLEHGLQANDGVLWEKYLGVQFAKDTEPRNLLEALALEVVRCNGGLTQQAAVEFLLGRRGDGTMDARGTAQRTLDDLGRMGGLDNKSKAVQFFTDHLRDYLAAREIRRCTELNPRRLIEFLFTRCAAFWTQPRWYHEHLWCGALELAIRHWDGIARELVSELVEAARTSDDAQFAQFLRAWAGFAAFCHGQKRLDPRLYAFDAPLRHRAASSFFLENAKGEDAPSFVSIQGDGDVANFEVSTTPVTVGQYARFVDDRKSSGTWSQEGKAIEEQRGFPNRPVVNVSWWEATAYCEWLGRRGHGGKVRLPTRDQWRTVAGQEKYPWGECDPGEGINARVNWWKAGLGRPAPVGTFTSNCAISGAIDFCGNVYEWSATPGKDPKSRLLLGAAWSTTNPSMLRSRPHDIVAAVTDRRSDIGFRCVISR